MRESKGKAIARQWFYGECLPELLTRDQLRGGNFLLLLGEEPREVHYLDALGVPRDHVWSVEHALPTYYRQMEMRLGIALYYGEAANYLEQLLHSNQRFLVLHLDVEGGYLKHIDPAMTSIILFAWRNPQLVLATTATIGRDSETLWEGVKSFAVCMALAPDATQRAVTHLSAQYERAGFTRPLRMVLRDLFWLRSALEHTAIASGMVGVAIPQSVKQFFAIEDAVWNGIAALRAEPLCFSHVYDIARAVMDDRCARIPLPFVGVHLSDIRRTVYKAVPPWSQMYHVARFATLETPISIVEWTTEALARFVNQSLLFIDREGTRHTIEPKEQLSLFSPETVVWRSDDLYTQFKPRRLVVQPKAPHLASTVRSLTDRVHEEQCVPHTEGDGVMGTNGKHNRRFTNKGELTSWGRTELQKLARKHRNASEVAKHVPSTVSITSIRAFVAIANRKPK